MSNTSFEPKISLTLLSLSAAAEETLAARPLPPELGKPQQRRMQGAVAKGGYDAENHTVTMTVSSETPIPRFGGFEILSHAAGAIDTARLDQGIPYLFNHDWDKHIGRSQSYQLQKSTLQITNKLGTNPLAKEKEQDIADGILPDVSIGYQPLKVDITEDKNGIRTYNVSRWLLYENSSVTVPADFSVGVSRSASDTPIEVEVTFRKLDADPPDPEDEDEEDEDEEDEEDDEERAAQKRELEVSQAAAAPAAKESTTTPTQQRTQTMDEVVVVAPDPAVARSARQSALFSIRNMNPAHYPEADLQRDLAGDAGVDVIAKRVSDAVIAAHQGTEVRSAADQVMGRMSEKEQRQYSMRNAIVATINQRAAGTFKDKGAEAGFEREVSDDIAKTLGQRGISASSGNILIPSNMGRMAQRSLQAGGNAGTSTINTVTSSDVIDLLRPRCRVLALGATEITVDTGLLRLPRQTGTSSSQWLSELAGSTGSDMTFDTIGFSPKRNGIYGSYTLELLAQSAISVEARVRADQLASKARTYDAVMMVGTGGTMPLGLLNMTGIGLILTGATRASNGTVTAGQGGQPVSFVDINNFEAGISNLNGDTGTLGWLYTPRVRAAMRSTAKFPGTGGFMPLLPDSATGADGLQEGPLGYKAGVTTNGLPTNGSVTVNGTAINGLHTMVLGVFENLIVANWGVSELVYDNITGAKQGIFNVIENEFMDVNCTHIEGFQASTTVLPS